MNALLLALLLFSSTATPSSAPDTYPKNPNIDALNYTFALTLSDETDVIEGKTTIDLRFLIGGLTEVRLDLISKTAEGKGMTVSGVSASGEPMAYSHQNNALLITLAAPSKPQQRMEISVRYQGIPASGLKIGPNKHGDRSFFSDNWPNRARNWLPTIDHPYDKATCAFIVTAPDHYQVISNGLKQEETNLPEGLRLTHWKQSVPIAPWLYVLGVARFAVQEVDTFEGKSIQTWVYPQDRDAGFYDFAVPTKAALAFYSNRVGPFSYEKLANIQSNSVGGGMEAASAIFYGDNSVTGQRDTRWRNVIIHEIAHQWFGNAVTEYDWDDVWLSEGFATYFTLLFIEHAYGRDEFVAGLRSSRNRVLTFHADRPDYRLVHDNLDDMSQVTTSQIYQKGSWVLHMLRGLVGEEAFWQGIQNYYRAYQDQNASTADFRRFMEEASGHNLERFFLQWLYQGGMPVLEGGWQYDATAKAILVTLEQVQDDAGPFELALDVGLYFEGQTVPQIERVTLSGASQTFSIPTAQAPIHVVLDPNFWVLMEASFTDNN